MSLETEVLRRITPTPDEEARVADTVAALETALRGALADAGLGGTPSVQGSIAKGTWLSGDTDLDCFLLMDPTLAEDDLKKVAESVGPKVLTDPRRKYAQHPYLIGDFQDMAVDLVPAYAVADASAHMSAVDRTPFHTAWVRAHLDDEARAQVRLLKQWCKGVGVYGAETAIGGFSGYLLEVLVHHFGSFEGVLRWFAAGATPRRMAPMGDDRVEDDVSPLVIVDPVDPARNVSAAVQEPLLTRAQEAATAYLAAPSGRFFFPGSARAEPAAVLRTALADADAAWLGLLVTPQTDRLDIVLPQFQKAARQAVEGLERAGFPVRRHHVEVLDGAVAFQWLTDAVVLPPHKVHRGPPPDQSPNAEKFAKKWDGHPDALTPVAPVDGRMQVTVTIHERTPRQWLERNADQVLTGKHVAAARNARSHWLEDPADAPADWAPVVADFILDRRPWER